MKKLKKVTAIILGGLAICLILNVSDGSNRSDDPRPEGQIQTIHLC